MRHFTNNKKLQKIVILSFIVIMLISTILPSKIYAEPASDQEILEYLEANGLYGENATNILSKIKNISGVKELQLIDNTDSITGKSIKIVYYTMDKKGTVRTEDDIKGDFEAIFKGYYADIGITLKSQTEFEGVQYQLQTDIVSEQDFKKWLSDKYVGIKDGVATQIWNWYALKTDGANEKAVQVTITDDNKISNMTFSFTKYENTEGELSQEEALFRSWFSGSGIDLTDKQLGILFEYAKGGMIGAANKEAVEIEYYDANVIKNVELNLTPELNEAVGITPQAQTQIHNNQTANKDEDDADIGGILFSPITALLTGIGNAINSIMGELIIGDPDGVGNDATLKSTAKNTYIDLYRYTGTNITADANNSVAIEIIEESKIKPAIGNYFIPNIRLTSAEIFSGKVAALDANFFKTDEQIESEMGGEEKSTIVKLKPIISQWYVALRNVAIVGLLSVLVYIGIRIVISSSAGEKAKYKQHFIDLVVALCLIFFMHYIMSFTMTITETVTDMLSLQSESGRVNQVVIALEGDNGITDQFYTNFSGLALIKTQYDSLSAKFGYTVIYLALTFYTVYFVYIYLKRLLMLAFFTIIAPLVALTYPIDKVKDSKAQAFNYWLREYIFYALLQPIHLLLYTVFVSSALELAKTNLLYAIVSLAFIVPAEKIVKQMFGIKGSTESNIGGFAGGAMAAQMFNRLTKGNKKSGEKGGNSRNNKPRFAKNPNGPSGVEAIAGNAEGLEGTQRPGIREQNNDDQNNGNEEYEQMAFWQDNVTANEPETENNNEPQIDMAQADTAQADTAQPYAEEPVEEAVQQPQGIVRRLANNFKSAANERWVMAGGGKGIAKRAGKGLLKGAARAAGVATLGTLGLGMGIVGGEMKDTLTGLGAGAMAGYWAGGKTGDAIGNTISGTNAVGRFAGDVLYGKDERIRRQFERDYVDDPNTRARILEKNPDFTVEQIRERQVQEARMIYDTGIDDYSQIKSAVKLENSLQAQGVQNSHDMTVELAKLAENYGKDTFLSKKKFAEAQEALAERLQTQMEENIRASQRSAEEQTAAIQRSHAQANEAATKTLERIRTLKGL